MTDMDFLSASEDPEVTDRIDLGEGGVATGFVEAGYGAVMDQFIENFRTRGDLGAGCDVYVQGRPVVSVSGGIADSRTGRRWERDTPAVIFSCTKGILAICAYLLVQEGKLDLDRPVAAVWPEFGQGGKEKITVREAMSHRAGVPILDRDLTKDQMLAWDPVIREIEVQRPIYGQDDGHAYHALTYGWLVGEVIRRITGMMPGRFFRSQIGDRLALNTWIGLPPGRRGSVAWMEPPLPDEDSEAARESARAWDENPALERSLNMGGAVPFPEEDGVVTFNAPEIQAAEVPGANGISSSPSLALLYGACVSDFDGIQLLSDASIADALRVMASGGQLTGLPDDGARWGTGFQLSSPPTQPMLGQGSFGHAGAGGQLAFADETYRVGFAYLSNQMGGYGDSRARELTKSLRKVLDG